MPLPPRFVLSIGCLLIAFAAPARAAANAPHPWPDDGFRPITATRIATLPAADQPAWSVYLAESEKRTEALRAARAEKLKNPVPGAMPRPVTATTANLPLRQSPAQFRGPAAVKLADVLVAWQTAAGGWVKERDYSAPPPPPATATLAEWDRPTFDNDTTIPEMRFLALAANADGDTPSAKSWHDSFLSGLDFVFAAQYPNGGFPQIYPLAGGYHDGITYNDGAMTNVLELLRDIADATPEFAFVPADQRAEAGRRLARGLACVLASQITVEGRHTVWCQQHDMLTLLPAAARNYEPACECSSESVGLVRFLMSLPHPSPEITQAIASARAWFAKVAIHDRVWNRATGLQPSAGAAPLWARFYETGSDLPIFGDRDHSIHYNVTEISAERQRGYAWFGNWPAALLGTVAP